MKKIIFILVFIPFIVTSQTIISTNLIQRTNSSEKPTLINMFENFYFGSFINDNLILGITSNAAISDYIEEGYSPVEDSLIVSRFQLFLKYYSNDFFFLMKIPPYTNFSNISINENIRIGVGYVLYKNEKIDLEVSYNRLLNSNENGFHKGELNLGISTYFPSLRDNKKYKKLKAKSFVPDFFYSVVDWINLPLEKGYKESL